MKIKLLPILVLVLGTFSSNYLFAQTPNFSFAVDSIVGSFQRIDTTQELTLTLTNSGGSPDTLFWKRYKHSGFPSAWTITTCDNGGCYLASVTSKRFIVPAHSTANITMNVTPNNVSGTGIIDLNIVSNNNIDSVGVYYRFNFSNNVGIGARIIQSEASIFPSPFQSNFNIKYSSSVKAKFLEVHNLLGAVVYKHEVSEENSDNINVEPGNLPKGLYFVTLSDVNRKAILTKRIQKD